MNALATAFWESFKTFIPPIIEPTSLAVAPTSTLLVVVEQDGRAILTTVTLPERLVTLAERDDLEVTE